MTEQPGPLPVVQAAAIERTSGPSWLVEDLWALEGVGILGGHPKSCKTWLALELALSVASGASALDRFKVPRAGPVLVFAAEDAPAAVRERLDGLALHKGVTLSRLPLHIILESSLRLDTPLDQARLAEAVATYQPRLLVLDPFVRLSRIDENSSQEVSGVLAYLRQLQRQQHVAIMVVHHARKAALGQEHAGLALRGSGDFFAWTDSTIIIRRQRGVLEMSCQHRNAASPDPVQIELTAEAGVPPYLSVRGAAQAQDAAADNLKERVLEELARQAEPATQELLRGLLRVRLQRLAQVLKELEQSGAVRRTPAGWEVVSEDADTADQDELSLFTAASTMNTG